MKNLLVIFKNIRYAISFVFRFKKSYIILALLISFISFVAPLTEVWAPKKIVDLLVVNSDFIKVLLIVGLVTFLELLKSIFSNIYFYRYLPKAQNQLRTKINYYLMDQASKLDYYCYETPSFFDKYTIAMREAENRFLDIINSLSSLLSNIIYLGSLSVIIVLLDPILMLLIAISVITLLFMKVIQSNLRYKHDIQHTSYDRKMNYIKRVLYEPNYAKEVRVFNVKSMLLNIFNDISELKNNIFNKQGKKIIIVNVISDSVRIILLISMVMIYVAYRIKGGMLSTGSFIALFIGTMQCTNQLIELLGSFSQFHYHSLYIDSFKEIMNFKSDIENCHESKYEFIKLEKKISFKNISFTYAGCSKPAINELTMDIKKGEKVALVGHNGAGKTTLIKLLLRLYDVNDGGIEFDDVNIKEYNIKSIRNKIGIVFQDYQNYSLTIAENILMRPIDNSNDEEIVWRALESCGLKDKVQKLEKGINTVISKEFDEDGTLLSGGELQKLALARIFVHDYDLIILDEPSSSLDPIAENDLFNKMINITKDKTIIYITHRLSTVTLADKVVLINDGKIMEVGTHEDLLLDNKLYAKMFKAQAEKFKKSIDTAVNM